ncbi:MAG TPA: phosphoribosylformylglycinamidine cyclo-ligase [Pirellulaceae bacterium]|nr:phosphoribosylformylglycinamidine cyclo-ligase [Pirellulaceae bacterium]
MSTTDKNSNGITYKDSGVDLEVYEQAMQRLPRLMHRTFSPRVRQLDGGFAGLFQLDFDNPLFRRGYEQPTLVACTDGVGTKLRVAVMADQHHTVGIDLVAMCVNDALCCGAEPLFFLDYVAMSHDDPSRLEQIVSGISEGCLQADCALLGGETAIMPDLYQRGDYDLAGFCVGVVEKQDLITGAAISPGDVVIGVASSGFHSNGYSLIRKVVFDHANLNVDDWVADLGTTVGQALLTPTLIYTAGMRRVLNHYKVKNVVHGVAHITGGGLADNIERILPPDVEIEVQTRLWECPAVFKWLQALGNVSRDEMFRVFNMGIGLVLIVSPYYADRIQSIMNEAGYKASLIGTVRSGSRSVHVVHSE